MKKQLVEEMKQFGLLGLSRVIGGVEVLRENKVLDEVILVDDSNEDLPLFVAEGLGREPLHQWPEVVLVCFGQY